MVPSWTETLVRSGIHVVGRTRFCIHPAKEIASIPAVGGTKDWNLEQVEQLKPDLILLDREENPRWMAEQAPALWLATHIQKIEDVPTNLRKINLTLNSSLLENICGRWDSAIKFAPPRLADLKTLPGIQKWIKKPEGPCEVLYLIWRKPFISVSSDTFIGSVFQKASGGHTLPVFTQKYPEIELSQFEKEKTLLLFSSEPFPFHRFEEEIRALDFPSALVDGEVFSWFGIRSLEFLESLS
ncbi:MAG: helical backbone metal receptor [Bdellovibrionales bacterium]|nr:helical backbone metal receptor [Bdellovibrionales bacterium]